MINPIDGRPFMFKTVFNDALTVTCSNENNYTVEIKCTVHDFGSAQQYIQIRVYTRHMHTCNHTIMFNILYNCIKNINQDAAYVWLIYAVQVA